MDNINFIYLESATKALDRCINEAATGSVARALYNAKEAVLSEGETMYNVQPVKHGKWIYVGSVRSWDEIKCSACNSAFSTEDRDLILNWDFCPHCGARMDGDQNDT